MISFYFKKSIYTLMVGAAFSVLHNDLKAENLSASITPSSDQLARKDENINFECTATGGCPPYEYSWVFANGSQGNSTAQSPTVSFGGNAEGSANNVTVTVKDSKGDTVQKSVKITVPKITFTGPSDTTEGTNSGKFKAKIEPSTLSASSYSWTATSPSGAGNSPSANFANPSDEETVINKARWFALPDSPWRIVSGEVANYKIKVSATIDGKSFDSSEKDWNVNVADGGSSITPFPPYAGMNTIQVAEQGGVWSVTTTIFFRRVAVTPVVNLSSQSQFYQQTLKHEQHHVNQFASMSPWKDMWVVEDIRPTIEALTASTEQQLRTAINSVINSWNNSSQTVYIQELCSMEWDACQNGNNAYAPAYRDYRQQDVPHYWGCSF